MAEMYPDEEIWQFAIDREIEAYYFFMALAERVASVEMRKVFEDLAGEELEHKEKLELEVMKTGKTVAVAQELKGSDKEYIISNTKALLDMDYKDMLLLGMEKEEAAFRIYVNLASSIHDEKSRDVLLALAEEEVRHKIRFQTEYDILLKNR